MTRQSISHSLSLRLLLLLLAHHSINSLYIPRGAYIHIPFCRRRCFYCNFPVVVVGERPISQQLQGEAYTALILREIAATLKPDGGSFSDLETVYFGGGTPSLLPVECIAQILKTLQSTLGFASNAEITLEMDPGTFDDDKLVKLRDAGVTRLSLGVQSFDSEILRKCGRAHTVDDIANSLRLVMASDFKDNFSIDLISSLPGLSDETWQNTLDSAASCGCSHISVYDLQIEDKTAFGRWYTPGIFPLPTDEQSASMYCSAAASLIAKGFEHYEVSNYAKAGKRSQHNQRYWKCLPTWGFGMGAASFIENNRFTRPDRMAEYSNWVTQLELEGFGLTTAQTGNLIVDNESNNTEGDSETDDLLLSDGIYTPPGAPDILEVVMLALRTSDGLDLAALRSVYGSLSVEKIYGAVKPFVERGLVVVTSEKLEGTDFRESTISLTDPEGFLLSNDIISSVFVELTC